MDVIQRGIIYGVRGGVGFITRRSIRGRRSTGKIANRLSVNNDNKFSDHLLKRYSYRAAQIRESEDTIQISYRDVK